MARAFRLRRRPAPNFHIVGDSTATPIEQRNDPDFDYTAGPGSAESGRGYTSGAPSGTITLTPPEAPVVIAQLSVWDYESGDLTGYSDADAYYQSFGITPIWVELPPSSAVGAAPEVVDPSAFNAAVASEIGVTLVPYAIRVVATSDGLHPTVQGAQDVVDRYTDLVGTRVSRLRGANQSTARGLTPDNTGFSMSALGAMTTAAAGTVVIEGVAACALGSMTTAATGTVIVSGAAVVDLGGMTTTATGTVVVSGVVVCDLGGVTTAATGTVIVSGVAACALGSMTTAASGTVVVIGVAACDLGGMVTAAAGTVVVVGESFAAAITTATTSLTAVTVAVTSETGILVDDTVGAA